MNGKSVVRILGMVGASFTAGFFFSKKYYERHYYDMVDDIYNECYRQAEAELRAQQPSDPEPDTKKVIKVAFGDPKRINEAMTAPYRAYDKPDLSVVAQERLGETKDWGKAVIDHGTEMTDQEFFGDEKLDPSGDVEDEIESAHEDMEDDGEDSNSPNRYLTEREYSETCMHFNKTEVFYYRSDNVFTGEDDQPMGVEEGLFDSGTIDLDRRLQQANTVYVRCYRLGTDYQIFCLKEAYHNIVAETPKERERRLTKRKMRD